MTSQLPIDTEFDEMIDGFAPWAPPFAEVGALLGDDVRRSVYGLMRAVQQRRAEIDDRAAWLAMITEEVRRDTEPKRRQIAWLETQIKALAEQLLVGKSKTVTVPGVGDVAYVDHSESLAITDDEAFIAALEGREERAALVEDRPHLKRNDAKKYAAEVLKTGEIMPGVERVAAHRTSTVHIEAGRTPV